MTQHAEGDDTGQRPVLRIVRGNPDDTEVAALVTALAGAARGNAGEAGSPSSWSVWNDRARNLRHPAGQYRPQAGRHTWRTSALPR